MLSNLQLPKELRQKIENEVQPGELIRWIEQPVPRFFTASSIGAILFGIPWTSFALFWMWGAAGFQFPNLKDGLQIQHMFALFGLPFVGIGLLMLSSPVWEWKTARKTVYVVTNQRAILIQGGWSTTIRSYLPDQLADVYRRERSNGTGDVIITVRRWQDSDGDLRSEEIGFLGIRNPREMEKMLKQLARNAG